RGTGPRSTVGLRVERAAGDIFRAVAVSSRGLGRSPLKAQTRVRIPLPLLKEKRRRVETSNKDVQQRRPTETSNRDVQQRRPTETSNRDVQQRRPTKTSNKDVQQRRPTETSNKDVKQGSFAPIV